MRGVHELFRWGADTVPGKLGVAGDWLPGGASPLASHNREPIFGYSQPGMAGVLVQGEVAAYEGRRHTETPQAFSTLHSTQAGALPRAAGINSLSDIGEPGPCLVMPLVLIMMAVYMGRALLGV